MAYAFYYEAPGTPEIYELVSREIGEARPDGLIVQVVTESAVGLRHLNVWESREQWEHFRDARVRPAVAAALTRLGISAPPEAPQEHPLHLVEVSGDAAIVTRGR